FTAPVVPLAAILVGEGRAAEAEHVLRAALARQPGNDAARVALLQSLIAQRRYAEAAQAASDERPGSPVGALAAACQLLARPAGRRERAGLAGAAPAAPALSGGWADALAGRPLPQLPPTSLEPALGALDELLAAGDTAAFETLLPVVERIDVPPAVRHERLTR